MTGERSIKADDRLQPIYAFVRVIRDFLYSGIKYVTLQNDMGWTLGGADV